MRCSFLSSNTHVPANREAPPFSPNHKFIPAQQAAHSTTRALYSAYAGGLYNVTRASDGATLSVPVLAPGGYADKKAHDAFCPKLDCVISYVLDQSANGNHLGQRHKLVNASQHPITAGGVPVYGMCKCLAHPSACAAHRPLTPNPNALLQPRVRPGLWLPRG